MMMRVAILALLLVAACSYYKDEAALEANILAPGNFKTGAGVMLVEMNASGFQSVDIDASTFLAGELIDITNDGRVVHLGGTSFNKLLGER